MTAPEILQGMAARGFVVALDGQSLSVSPSSRLTPKLRDALKQHKGELLELLAHGNPFASTVPLDTPTGGGDGLGVAAETAIELLRRLRSVGCSLQLRAVAVALNAVGEVAPDGSPLVWAFPSDAPDAFKRDSVEKLAQHREAIATRLLFERWHWRACAEHFGDGGKRLESAPASMPYRDWKQFARVQCGAQSAEDLRDLARFIQAARHECEKRVFYGRVKIAWRVVAALSDREPSLSDVARWASLVLDGEAA